jgi:putative membrane protein
MMNTKTLWAAALALPLVAAGVARAQSTSAPAATPSTPLTPGAAAPSTMAPASADTATAPADLSAADRKFIQKAAIGGLAEVQVAQLAEQKTQDPTVKAFAEKMIADHTPNNEQLVKLAESKGVTPPTELDSMHAKQMTKLQSLSGRNFDTTYLKGQEKDHAMMLKTFKAEAKSGHDPDLKQFAQSTIPTIEAHEHLAETDTK